MLAGGILKFKCWLEGKC